MVRAFIPRILCVLLISLLGSATASAKGRLLIYAGAASKPPTDEAVRRFEEKTGIKTDVIFGGSGYVLAQMKLAREGDLYFPGSSDYMDKAKREGDVIADTERIIVYLVSAINVQKGNPHRIRGLKDLIRPGITVAIANPEGVCVGAYAVEIIENQFSPEEKQAFRKNLLNYTASCEKTATAISLKQVDAVIGWGVFNHWDPDRIETIPLKPSEIVRVGYIPIAISRFTQNRKQAESFIEFLTGEEGRAIFARHHYFAHPEEAFSWLGATKPVGGEYTVPREWLQK